METSVSSTTLAYNGVQFDGERLLFEVLELNLRPLMFTCTPPSFAEEFHVPSEASNQS